MILEFHRGHIRLLVGDKIVRILGEVLLPGHGSPDFVAYRNSLMAWEVPQGEPISTEERERIESALAEALAGNSMRVEFE